MAMPLCVFVPIRSSSKPNIHYPTESTLIGDGMRKIIPLCAELAQEIGEVGWRQTDTGSSKLKSKFASSPRSVRAKVRR